MTLLVAVILGSRSDWETISHAGQMLDKLGVPYEPRVMSAHRTPAAAAGVGAIRVLATEASQVVGGLPSLAHRVSFGRTALIRSGPDGTRRPSDIQY